MLAAIADQMRESGQAAPTDPPAVAKVILDSLAQRYASVFRTIEHLTGTPIDGIQIIGGGSQNGYLNQATATATGKPVLAGPIEATAIGNAVVQAIAGGRFASLAEARAHVARHVRPTSFAPRPTAASASRSTPLRGHPGAVHGRTHPMSKNVEQAYRLAAERYQEFGVDTEAALARLKTIPVSLHCWQGDDVRGFEQFGGELTGGIAATGNYPGAARTPDELRADATKALSLIPGRHRFNLHAFYGEFGGARVDRDEIRPEHFAGWIDWAKSLGIGLDFNPTYFSHPNAADNFTLSHPDDGIRAFWVRHGIACREDRRGHGPRARQDLRHQLLDSRRHEGHAGRSEGAARAADRAPSTRSSRHRSIRPATSTRSKASCSASASRATRSARTSSTSPTR